MSTDETIEARLQQTAKMPRVTPADIEAIIVEEYYGTANKLFGLLADDDDTVILNPAIDSQPMKLLTLCVLVLKNGFTVTGQSACASPENFNEAIGRDIARKDAVSKIWMLEGYLLRSRIAGALPGAPAPDKIIDDLTGVVDRSHD